MIQCKKYLFSIFMGTLMLTSGMAVLSVHDAGPNSGSSSQHSTTAMIPAKGHPVTSSSLYSYAVNPYILRTTEPAPMGIADYGIGPGGTPYSYNTTSFLGVMNISSLYASSSGSSSVSVQLNVILQFTLSNGTAYVYWIQDVAFISTASPGISGNVQFIDNVWNMSSPSANMHNTTIQGNGTVYTYGSSKFYYDGASFSLPGNNLNMNYPGTILFKVNSYETPGSSGNTPAVAFQYNDGFGRQTYDNVAFGFASGLVPNGSDQNFVVDGHQYNPYGTYYDAELILGGPGGGSTTVLNSADVNLSLQYYNGHNYREIANAYNFGSDTAETISNVFGLSLYYIDSGYIFESLTAGAGNLNLSYSSSSDSWISINTSLPIAYLYINGLNSTEFSGGSVNYTIAPGTYTIQVYDPATGNFVAVGGSSVTVLPGTGASFNLNYNPVVFDSSGLPAGTSWWVTLNGNVKSTTGSEISFNTTSGTSYSYTVKTSSHYTANPSSGTFTAGITPMTISVSWTEPSYTVYFNETGLPSGTFWTVNFNKSTADTSSQSISYMISAGIHGFSVQSEKGYVTYPSYGELNITGNMAMTISFVKNSSNKMGVVSSSIMLGNSTTVPGEYFPILNYSVFPYQAAYDSQNGMLYTANAHSSSVSVIDTKNNRVVDTIALHSSNNPGYVIYDSYNHRIYVGDQSGNVYVIDTGTNSVSGTLVLLSPNPVYGFAVNPANGTLYVLQEFLVEEFSSSDLMTAQFQLNSLSHFSSIGYDSASGNLVLAYINQSDDVNVSIVNASSLAVIENISVSGSVYITSILYDSYSSEIYLTARGNVTVLNATSYARVGTIIVNSASFGATVDPFTGYVYISMEPRDPNLSYFNLTVVDGNTNSVIGTIPLPYASIYPVYASGVQEIYVPSPYVNSVYAINPQHYYPVNISESSLPAGMGRYVNVSSGRSYYTNGSYLSFYEPDGNYTYSVSVTNSTWRAASDIYSAEVSGSSLSITTDMVRVTYSLVFSEQGLGSGATWYVTVDGQNLSALAGSNITVQLINGTYSYSMGSVSGYSLTNESGNITLNGSNRSVSATYTAKASPHNLVNTPGLSGTEEVAVIAAAVILIAGLAVWRLRK